MMFTLQNFHFGFWCFKKFGALKIITFEQNFKLRDLTLIISN